MLLKWVNFSKRLLMLRKISLLSQANTQNQLTPIWQKFSSPNRMPLMRSLLFGIAVGDQITLIIFRLCLRPFRHCPGLSYPQHLGRMLRLSLKNSYFSNFSCNRTLFDFQIFLSFKYFSGNERCGYVLHKSSFERLQRQK